MFSKQKLMQLTFSIVFALFFQISFFAHAGGGVNLKGQNHLISGVEQYKLLVKFSAEAVNDVDHGEVMLTGEAEYAEEDASLFFYHFNQAIQYKPEEKAMMKQGIMPPPTLGKFNHYAFKGLVYVAEAENMRPEEVLALANAFEKLSFVEYAALEPVMPITPPATPDFTGNQHYKYDVWTGGTNVRGINAEYAWSIGITGQGVKIADIEWGFDYEHEDLKGSNFIELISTTNHSSDDHGTAVAGIMFARDNGFGMKGMVHGADVFYGVSEIRHGRPAGIARGLQELDAGDVFLYEMQTGGQNGEYVPADYNQAVWDITKSATDAGVIIVAAAGNGNENLDAAFYANYRARGDNGAIRIGAGTKSGRNKASFSTYGSPVHIQGWGDWSVAATGYGALYNGGPHATYTNGFSGTSSATPIAASAVVAVQSWYKRETGMVLSPREMRALLIETGTAQGTGGHIGPLPNIQKAIEKLMETVVVPDYDIAVADFEHTGGTLCGSELSFSAKVSNKGTQTITSFFVDVYFGGNLHTTLTRNITLARHQESVVSLNNVSMPAVLTPDVKIVLRLPSGQTDGRLQNNELEISVPIEEIPYGNITGVSASSMSSGQGIANTLDSDANTIWHNNWGAGHVMPYELVYDLGAKYDLFAVDFLNRQNNANGVLKDVDFYVSDDQTNWSSASRVSFDAVISWQERALSGSLSGRYVKMIIRNNHHGTGTASFAEIRFKGCLSKALTVSLVSPSEGTVFNTGENIVINASASSVGTISKVEFYINGQLVSTDNTAPYTYTMPSAQEGTYQLLVKAYDNAGGVATSDVVTVQVRTPLSYDLSLSELKRLGDATCGTSMNLSFKVKNMGVVAVTNFQSEVYFNNELINQQTHNETLLNGQEKEIVVNNLALLSSGAQAIKVVIKLPNGEQDQQAADNEATLNATVSLGSMQEFFIAERSANANMAWSIRQNGSTVLTSASVQATVNNGNKVQAFCLADACYEVVVTNAFSGGTCSAEAWNSQTEYCSGRQVSYNGRLYESKWCGRGNVPSDASNYQWTDLGECAVSHNSDTYGVRKQGGANYFIVAVQNYTSPKTNAFCVGNSDDVDFTMNANGAVTTCNPAVFSTTATGVSYTWHFGNGASPLTATGTGPHTVQYATTGSKNVRLTVDGKTTLKNNFVSVTNGSVTPQIAISLENNQSFPICSGSTVLFESQTQGIGSAVVSWYVNQVKVAEGNTYTMPNPIAGELVSARVTSNDVCAVTTSEIVSNAMEVHLDVCTSVFDRGGESENVFPNPFSDQLHIEIRGEKELEVLDVFGNVYWKGTGSADVLNTGSWNAGVYILKINLEEKTLIYKLVKE